MAETRTLYIDAEHAVERWSRAKEYVRQFLAAGKPVRLRIDEKQCTRTLEQNDKLHAICHDISQQRQWAGHWIDTEGWKRLLVDAWARHEGKAQGSVVPSLDGQSIVNLSIQTRRMRASDMSELIEFAQAWAVDNEVRLSR